MFNKTPLSHVPNLIDDYRKYAIEASNDKDMVELYGEDATGFQSALGIFVIRCTEDRFFIGVE